MVCCYMGTILGIESSHSWCSGYSVVPIQNRTTGGLFVLFIRFFPINLFICISHFQSKSGACPGTTGCKAGEFTLIGTLVDSWVLCTQLHTLIHLGEI